MRLVAPAIFDPYRIEGIAHSTADYVDSISIHNTLQEAIEDCVYVVALTARERAAKRTVIRPGAGAAELMARADRGTVAIVAGREDKGLTNDELDRCHALVTIPTNPAYRSLNLAQAVAIMCYEIQPGGGRRTPTLKAAPQTGRRPGVRIARAALRRLGAGPLGHRFLQDPPGRACDAVLPRNHLPGGPGRPGGGSDPGDGNRGSPFSRTKRCAGPALGSPTGPRLGFSPKIHLSQPGENHVGRSAAYWAANLYPESRQEPKPSAPYRDLPGPIGARFRKVREGLLALPGVSESVKFMGPSWRWAWEYAAGSRKLCWLHVMQNGVGGTFTLSDGEERKALAISRLPSAIGDAILSGHRTGPLRWCSIEITDQKAADVFVGFARRKLAWLTAETPAAVLARRTLTG